MKSCYFSLIYILFYVYNIYAMDTDDTILTECSSPLPQLSYSSSIGKRNQFNAPLLTASDKPKESNTLNQSNSHIKKIGKKGRSLSVSAPAPITNNTALSNPTNSPYLVITDHTLTPSMIDNNVWDFLAEGREIAQKVIAKKTALKTSHFYHILEHMQQSSLEADVHSFTFANYFLFSLLETKNSKLLIDPGSDSTRRGDYSLCINFIKKCIDQLTQKAIHWPSVTRQEDKELYYQELITLNKDIDIPAVKGPYIGANIIIQFLPQLIERSPGYKKAIQEFIKRPKNITKIKNNIFITLAKQGLFIDKKFIQCTLPVKNKKHAIESDSD
jgi:hypothetical protein